jgi:murein DD-endopeptidase MepM/ murein hydrolase activator NlpD
VYNMCAYTWWGKFRPMVEYTDSFLFKIRFLVGSALIVIALMLLPLFVSLIIPNPKVQAQNSNTSASSTEDLSNSPNIITSGLFTVSDNLSKSTGSAGKAVKNGTNSAMKTFADTASSSSKVVAHGAGSSAAFLAHGLTGGFGLMARAAIFPFKFAAHSAGSIFGIISKPPAISSVVRPADQAHVEVINRGTPPLPPSKAIPAQNAVAQSPQSTVDTSAQWPIHGKITTEFGASDWPYQMHHTGIDIADGQRAGTTPIHPYKPGKVIQVIHSSVSLGNHVVVDNGGGITSVYGHMYATNVQVGQQVDKNSVLGWVGSTGASTGPHVHFEIWLNGVLQNPHNYVPGQP